MIASLKRLRIYLVLLTLLNMVPVALPGFEAENAWTLLAISAAAALLSCLLDGPLGQRRMPRWVMVPCVFGTAAYFLYEALAPHTERTVYLLDLGHFLMLLCCCKFFELRGSRDLGVLFLISFLLVVVGAFVSASILYGVVVAVDVTFGLGWFIAYRTHHEMHLIARRRSEALPSGVRSGPAVSVPGGHWKRPADLSLTLRYSLGLIVLATLIFVSIPRGWGREIFGGIQRIIPGAVTGFTNEVFLDGAGITADMSPVMRVRFYRDGYPIEDEAFRAYMRGRTFDRYFRGRWRRTPSVVPNVLAAGSFDSPVRLAEGLRSTPVGQVIEQRVWLEGIGYNTLFAMYAPVTFGSGDVEAVEQDRHDLVLSSQQRVDGRIKYRVHSILEVPREVARSMETQPEVPRDGFSGISDRIKAFSREFASRHADPTDPTQQAYLVQRICDYLRSDEFVYTLEARPSRGEGNPVEAFLFVNKRGHCEYFASAMTLMCQAVGIRARLVGGYCGGEFNSAEGFYQFRQKDAHAWVEVYLPQRGWVTFDPSPASEAIDTSMIAGFLGNMRRITELLEFKWSAHIISFDVESRRRVFEHLASWLGKIEAGFRAGAGSPDSVARALSAFLWGPEVFTVWQRLFYWLLLVLCVAFVALALRVLWILSLMVREFVSTRRRGGTQMVRRPEAKFYDRLLLLLANKGHVKPNHLTPREFALSLSLAHDELRDVTRFTEWFYEAQYGRRRLDGGRWRELRVFLRSLREDPSFGSR